MENQISVKPEPSALFRWIILVFVSLAMFGNYYIYDSISPLADLLVKQLNFSDSNIGLLQGIYSVPNVLMVLIGGIIIDKIGTRISTFIFTVLCLTGAIITASSSDLTFMAIGRLVFGLGAESMIVAVTTVIGRWFKGKQLSFAFGLNLTLARLGSFAALNSPTWAKSFYDNWQLPLLISVVAGVISVLSVIIYWGMDTYAEKNFSLRPVPKQDKINFKEIFSFSKSYWFVVLLCVTFYLGIFPFQTFAVKFFIDVHGTSREFGGFLSSMLTLSAMILTPLFGLFADYIGKRSLLMMFGSLILVPVYLIMAYTNVTLYIPMAMMGLTFSLIPAVMWPSVAIIVDEAKLGTAYGLMTMIQNIGLAGFNFIIGWANDFSGGYSLGMWIFSSLGFFGLLFAFLLRKSEMGPNSHGLEKGIKQNS
ncbi:MAG: major facilitator superfamily domain-containing protein 1 [Ignavibacteria bacterium]|nr:major facilitator superfamily domain-containing protein 1 [Ignavibacteria bacterium]